MKLETYLLENYCFRKDPSLLDVVRGIVIELGGSFDGPVNASKYSLVKKRPIRPLPAITELTDKLQNIKGKVQEDALLYTIKLPKKEFNFFLYRLYDYMVGEKLDLLVTSRIFRKVGNDYKEVDTT